VVNNFHDEFNPFLLANTSGVVIVDYFAERVVCRKLPPAKIKRRNATNPGNFFFTGLEEPSIGSSL